MHDLPEPGAVLDVGSNTVRLLVARVFDGEVHPLADRSAFVRLGQGVDASGRLDRDRMVTAIGAIRDFAREARTLGAATVIAIATSAVRDAENGQEFSRRVREETGVDLEIISGDREAELTFLGATIGIDLTHGAVICDLGGGSAELIAATADGIRWRQSVKLGSGRLTERFVHHDPPPPSEIESVQAFVVETLRSLPRIEGESATGIVTVFTGGTASHMARMLGSQEALTHTNSAEFDRVLAIVSADTAATIAQRYTFQLERTEVLPAGTAALAAIGRFYRSSDIIITRHGIREGALLAAGQG